MKKRETILLAVLGVVVVVAIIIFVVAAQPAASPAGSPETPVKVSTGSVMTALAGAQSVLTSEKFTTLVTYGKIPVVVEPFEIGNKQPLNPSR